MRSSRLVLALVAPSLLVPFAGCDRRNNTTPTARAPEPLTILFETRHDIATGSRSVSSFEAVDFDGNGRLDLFVSGWNQNRVRCLPALPDGSYSLAGWSQQFASPPGELATLDLSNNGTKDIACLFAAESVVRLFRNDGKGIFSEDTAAALSVGTSACGLVSADINGDGIDDLAICSRYGLDILLYKGLATGSFELFARLGASSAEFSRIALADLNADGRLDLMAADLEGSKLFVWQQSSQGFTGQPTSLATGGLVPVAVHAHDVDLDGLLDVLVANFVSEDISVFRGKGQGALESPTLIDLDGLPWDLCVGDVNADGKPDYVVSYLDRADAGVLDGDGRGGVTHQRQLSVTGLATECQIVDLDADGKPDLLTSALEADGLAWHRGVAPIGLSGAEDFTTGHDAPRFVAGFDVDGDGKGDALISDEHAGVVTVMRGSASGALEAATDVAVGAQPNHISTGDLDGDGKTDAVVSLAGGVRFLLNRSSSAGVAFEVQPPTSAGPFAAGVGPFVTACARIDGDTLDDLVVADFGGNKVSVFRRRSAGLAFAMPGQETPIDGGPLGLGTGDFNADGHVDVAVSRWRRGSVAVLINDGAGAFKVPQDLVAGPAPNYLVVADFDGNGADDIVVSNLGSSYLTMFKAGRQDPGFRTSLILLGSGPAALVVHDFDVDGKLDLLVTNFASADFHVLLGDAAGQFDSSVRFPGTFLATSAALSDVNGDGLPDLVTAGLESKRVGLTLNRSKTVSK